MSACNTVSRPLRDNILSAGRCVFRGRVRRSAAVVFAEMAERADAIGAHRPAFQAVAADLRAKALRAEARA